MEGYLVHVEVKVMIGVDSIVIVGLPDASVKESKERVAAALHSQGYSLSSQKSLFICHLQSLRKMGRCLILPWP
jgi:magnesium chelatase family protein